MRRSKFGLTLSHEVDESGNHEHRMKVELSLVASPSERNSILGLELDDPIEAERHDAVEEDLGHEDQEAEAALGAPGHAVIVVFTMSEERKNG